jgi:tetratricopeptide (TPR) repeat protein
VLGLMKLVPAVLTFLAVRSRVRQEGSHGVLWCVSLSGILVALVSLLHRLTGWDRVYDFYEPLYVHADPLPAPFLNANHLAGALGLAAAVTIGLAFDEKDRFKRLVLVAAAGFTGGAVLLTLSRGGIICFVAGQVLFVGLRLFHRLVRRSGSGRGRRELAALPLALAMGVASGSYVALRSIIKEFVQGDAHKFQIWLDALPMVRSYWLAGSGRGTFGQAYTGFQELPNTVTYLYPENFLANWLGEWGIPVGGLFMIVLVTIVVTGLLRPPRRARNAGALVAIFVLLVQNFVDFSIEILGVTLPFAVVLAVESVRLEMSLGSKQGKSRHLVASRVPRWLGLAAPVSALALVAAGLPLVMTHGLEADEARVRSVDLTPPSDESFDDVLAEAMARHPADFHLPLLGGIRAFHTGRSDPLPLLGRSLTLFPRSAVAHLYVARTVSRAGLTDQALLEYMEAMRSRPSLARTAADEVIAITDGFEQARKLARIPEDRLQAYAALAEAYLRAGDPEEARRADMAALEADPRAPRPLVRTIRRHIVAGMWNEARELAERLRTVPDFEARAMALEGEIEHREGNHDQALELYRMAYDRNRHLRPVLLKMAQLHHEQGDREALFEALDSYQASATDEKSLGLALVERARWELRLGLTNQALASYRDAASSLPGDARIWKAIAELHEKLGNPVAALDAYRELSRIEPDNPDWKQKLDAAMVEAQSKALILD